MAFAWIQTLKLNSIGFCQCKFDKSYIRIRLGGCSGHEAMIPLLCIRKSSYANLLCKWAQIGLMDWLMMPGLPVD